MKEEPRILIVCGSPRKANSEMVSRKLVELLEGKAVPELVLLSEKNIQPWHEGHDKAKDDMPKLLEKFRTASAYIFVSPSYFGMPPGILKNFIDRTDVFFGQTSKFSKKFASIVSIGASPLGGGIEHNAECIRSYFHALGIRTLDIVYLIGKEKPEEILKEKDAIERLPQLVDNLLEAIKRFSEGGIK